MFSLRNNYHRARTTLQAFLTSVRAVSPYFPLEHWFQQDDQVCWKNAAAHAMWQGWLHGLDYAHAQAALPESGVPGLTPLGDDEHDPVRLWAEIHALRAAVRGPAGYDSWQQAGTDERLRRVKAERALEDTLVPQVRSTELPTNDPEAGWIGYQHPSLLDKIIGLGDLRRQPSWVRHIWEAGQKVYTHRRSEPILSKDQQ